MMRFVPLFFAMLLIFMLCSCSSTPTTYYTLTPAERSSTSAEGWRPTLRAILVLRSLPPGIDTTQILIRTDDTRLRVEESSRWVAPLGDEFRGALVDALRHQYGIIVSDGARRNDASVPRIDLTVRKFDVAEGSSIILAVDWVLANPGKEPHLSSSCQAEFAEPSAATISGAVAAGQAAVLKLSRVLGAAIEASMNGATPTC
jgi:uncharacterized protein